MKVDAASFLEFTGKTVLVTGSSRNLGKTIARAFVEGGARVVLHGSGENLEKAKKELESAYPDSELHSISFDLGQSEAIDAAFEQLETDGWMPDVLVNNAAHLGLGESGFLEQTPE
ncbi:MAG: SDR family NAD(P)-dependent oxidoreductase, partial [Puniceicoccales bacterium]